MTRNLKLFLLTGAMFIAPVAFSDCTPKVFNVNVGCPLAATGDGVTDDRPAIQQCLLAAGEHYKECNEPTTPEVPIEVVFGPGTYFVSGAFRSQILEPRVSPHWIALILPRGVAMRGAGAGVLPGDVTTLTIRKTPEDRPVGAGSPRAGTFLIAAGVEKITKTERVNGQLVVLDRYCDEDLPSGDPGPNGHPRPLCDGSQAELEKGGAYNAIYDMKLLGDSYAMVKHVGNDTSTFDGRSAALYLVDGLKFKMAGVRVEEWYRGVFVAANGIEITHSQAVNVFKGGLYLGGIWDVPEGGREPRYGADTYGDNPFHVEGNWLGNETTWLAAMDTLRNQQPGAQWEPVSSLAGLLFSGNGRTCGNLTVDGNRLYRSRIVIDPPCHQEVVVTDNWISLSGLAISIGAGSGNFPEPGGLMEAKAIVRNNTIDSSLAGILIQGCNFNGEETAGRCALRTADQAVVEDNELTGFRAYRSPGSDPYLDRMSRWVGTGSVFAAISIADISGVKVNGNEIRDLKRGTHMAGIFTHTSYLNVRPQPTPNCYPPFRYNQNIHAYGNEIKYSPDRKANEPTVGFVDDIGLGFYTENTLDFGADHRDFRITGWPAAPMVVDANRTINTQITFNGFGFRDGHCDSAYGSDSCPRVMIKGDHIMSGTTNPCNQNREVDREFRRHPND